ncbi:MAG: hypothetical protein KU29_10830, partial [Sulfurovum sp. FS06-10]
TMDTNIKEIIKGYSNFQSVKFKKNEERYKNLVEEGNLFLHGWYYDIKSGSIEYYNDELYEFRELTEKNGDLLS